MPGILDIAPPEIITERFDIRGDYVEVRALRNREWAVLLRRFPHLRQQLAGAAEEPPDPVTAIEMIPAVVAAGLVLEGVEATKKISEIEIAVSKNLSDEEQKQLCDAIMRLTNTPAPLAGSPVEAGQVANGQAETNTPPALSN